ncbi:craniofacial development protein 2-like [Leguminivora glycinivorella]|uniref:craniofacial development protein 2-like n=1 Tax=Leguminivora glycinivorella TaxID=1035111 RepID=UPI00200F5F2F|nr:craniofacial development protein 2-like [Leguminivora glycinivorella]
MRTGFPNTCENLDIAQDLRKTYNIDVELNRLKVDIAALQETRIEDEGSLREAHYTFYWKGKSSTETREHGVGFAVRNQLIDAIETPVGVSERIMVLRLNTKSGYVTLISAYAPTLHSTSETKDQFYNQLDEVLRGVRPSDRLHILGDFNARVGQDNTDWPDCLGAWCR